MTTSHVCAECGAALTRRPGEHVTNYGRRVYCNRTCAAKGKGRVTAERRTRERAQYVTTEVEHLLGSDHPGNIARRLGYADLDSLVHRLRVWGRDDLVGRLLRARAAA